jgi:MFS family permease
MLIGARAVQGIGGAIVQSVALSVILDLLPEPAARAKAMSVWGFVASAGAAVGVVLGGVGALVAALPNAKQRSLEGQDHGAAPEVLAPLLKEFFR